VCEVGTERSRAVFLDRDGVLNSLIQAKDGSCRPPWSKEEIQLSEGAIEAVRLLLDAGLLPLVVTNQPDVGKESLSAAKANSINEAILLKLPELARIYSCFHSQGDGCDCRKPRPGMLRKAASEWGLDLSKSWLVGDRWVDILAGKQVGCRTVLIEHSSSWTATSAGRPPADLVPTGVVDSVLKAALFIVDSEFSRIRFES